jgi:SAM-dependent methyltransferase
VTIGERRYRLRCIDKLGFSFRGDESLLECGCGDGGVARMLRERVGDVVGIDVEPFDTWNDEPGLAFQVADAEELPFGDSTFDLVHSKDSLHHMESPLALGHEHFSRGRYRELVTAAFPHARFGAFEAHYVPGLNRGLPVQHAVEEGLERFPPFRPLLSYNFAVT